VPLGLDPIIVGDILRRHQPSNQNWTDTAPQAFGELLAEAEKRSDDQSLIQTWYRKNKPAAAPFYAVAWVVNWPNEFPDDSDTRGQSAGSSTRGQLRQMLDAMKSGAATSTDDAQAILNVAYQDESPVGFPVRRQASGVTRLVFDMDPKKENWPYCLDTLLSWSEHLLKVTQRAMRFDVNPGSTEVGLVEALQKQNIGPTSTIDKRLADVVKQASIEPSDFETCIELPTRLYLSPAGDAKFSLTHPPRAAGNRVPIWQAQLCEVPGKTYSLRAVGSPDFKATAFKRLADQSEGDKAPPRGVNDENDFRSSLDKFDRHQLVALSSVYGLPVIARKSNEGVVQTSQIAPPAKYRLTNLFPSDLNEQALYIPRSLPFRELALSPLGASLDLEALFVPPASVRDTTPKNLYDAFSIERLRAKVSLGRDVTTEVVYKGFLYPIGFRATLVKITERFYLPWPEVKPRPVALLRQRLFIQISNPTKTFPAVNQLYAGRGWPAQSITLDTDHTPDLLDPVRFGDPRSNKEIWTKQPNGRLDHKFRVGLVFWPRTTPGDAGNIQFRMRIDDRPETVSMPLIFIDNAAAHDARTMRLLRDHYNNEVPVTLRQLEHGGVRRRYAPEEKPGDTTFETLEWIVAADQRDWQSQDVVNPEDRDLDDTHFLVDSAMESVDQPPVYPRLQDGLIRHDSSARFSGNAQPPTKIKYFDQYLKAGFLPRENPGKPDRDLGKQAFLVVTGDSPRFLEWAPMAIGPAESVDQMCPYEQSVVTDRSAIRIPGRSGRRIKHHRLLDEVSSFSVRMPWCLASCT